MKATTNLPYNEFYAEFLNILIFESFNKNMNRIEEKKPEVPGTLSEQKSLNES